MHLMHLYTQYAHCTYNNTIHTYIHCAGVHTYAAHTWQQRVDGSTAISCLKIGADDARTGLTEAHAQQRRDFLYAVLE